MRSLCVGVCTSVCFLLKESLGNDLSFSCSCRALQELSNPTVWVWNLVPSWVNYYPSVALQVFICGMGFAIVPVSEDACVALSGCCNESYKWNGLQTTETYFSWLWRLLSARLKSAGRFCIWWGPLSCFLFLAMSSCREGVMDQTHDFELARQAKSPALRPLL